MLAPRKKLWSTPIPVVDAVASLTDLTIGDRVYDLGCGDCRVLIHLAKTTKCKYFVGIEIDSSRVDEARRKIRDEKLCPSIHFEIRCGNALEACFDDATVVFLYLIPRGLMLVQSLLTKVVEKRRKKEKEHDATSSILRVVTYMTQLKGEQYDKMLRCSVDHQPLAEWPLYLYNFT